MREPPLLPRLTVACSLTKGEKPELVVQKLTELGVDRILLVEAARSVVRWDDDARPRPCATVCGGWRAKPVRSRAGPGVPVVDGPGRRRRAGVDGRDWCSRPVDGVAPSDAGRRPRAGSGWSRSGPEGGFDPDELAAFDHAPRLAVGPFVLRAETAAIAVAAALAGHRSFSPARHI